ncbi:MAG: GxxExxY protein [gamma proteobacterium symbiont of Ctena orbiculata]|nr:GxxExxY protein [Candidatus Thiodiazotropha sp. (ex Lucina pensylvanica)]MBT3062662.1 GxxExxY protein [Candidatus Thiodiazotropha sp. (ex Lucina pensylvanica)]MBV2096450.1 GxxExxY protein [Candidatus Thiodiazotropha sp. (ex Codakia orbicularis)]PUB76332.1 MAG: GxxExxY protein [gamma proteobacterium symbiont of Ctena orbiculata]PUB79424.1 MAG: GxxExxY protein [gamma proteobacterium symbiont of Ctena orbiculata]
MKRPGEAVSKRVIGCGYEVSNELGAGFFEAVYENALCLELERQGLAFERQKYLEVGYKDHIVGHYVADIVVENLLLVELKALSTLTKEHDAQVMNYLRATGLSVGLLLNFGTPRLGVRRLVWQHDDASII